MDLLTIGAGAALSAAVRYAPGVRENLAKSAEKSWENREGFSDYFNGVLKSTLVLAVTPLVLINQAGKSVRKTFEKAADMDPAIPESRRPFYRNAFMLLGGMLLSSTNPFLAGVLAGGPVTHTLQGSIAAVKSYRKNTEEDENIMPIIQKWIGYKTKVDKPAAPVAPSPTPALTQVDPRRALPAAA